MAPTRSTRDRVYLGRSSGGGNLQNKACDGGQLVQSFIEGGSYSNDRTMSRIDQMGAAELVDGQRVVGLAREASQRRDDELGSELGFQSGFHEITDRAHLYI
jgi:hypothetical protein